MAGADMTAWLILILINTSGSIIEIMNFPMTNGILTVSNLFEVLLKDFWLSSMGILAHFLLTPDRTEFRINHRRDNLYHEILKLLRLNLL